MSTVNGTLSLSPRADLPGDRGGIVTTTWGHSGPENRPFFLQTVEGWLSVDGGAPQRAKVVFSLASGCPSSLKGLVQTDAAGCPLAATAPQSTKNGHLHQVLVRKSRAVVRCELELVKGADPAVPGSCPEYTAWDWVVKAPVDVDERLPTTSGLRFQRAASAAVAPAAAPAVEESDEVPAM